MTIQNGALLPDPGGLTFMEWAAKFVDVFSDIAVELPVEDWVGWGTRLMVNSEFESALLPLPVESDGWQLWASGVIDALS